MVKLCFVAVCFCVLVLFVQSNKARNTPSGDSDITISDKTPVAVDVATTAATVPSGGAAVGVKDEKNFIAYGGVGGFAGVGGYTGVLPTLGGVGGLGVPGAAGGLGGLGGAGGVGGAGGLGGLGGGIGAVKGGGIGGGIIVP